ncbi:hypothetical protein ACGFIY_00030 [Micromonospora chersina]|uniref:hypothetical protein n=1 Tax=Micromonospora chersina TaxID=47854 RepID=UPI003718B52D
MTRFRQALLNELLVRVEERPFAKPAPAPRTTRSSLALVAALGTAGVVGAVAALAGTVADNDAKPAYAVTTDRNGSVTITVNYLGDPADANRILQEAGVQAKIMPPVPADSCDTDQPKPLPLGSQGFDDAFRAVLGDTMRIGAGTIRIQPSLIRADTLLVIAPETVEAMGNRVVMYWSIYPQPGPSCVVEGSVRTVIPLTTDEPGPTAQPSMPQRSSTRPA